MSSPEAVSLREDCPSARIALRLNGVHVSYGTQDVLKGVDLDLPSGQVHGLVGRNGAGKTTLLNAVTGFVRTNRGSITIDERAARLEDVSYVPVSEHFYSNITGREFLGLFQTRAVPQQERRRWIEWADAWARAFKLPLDSLIDTYSSGMRRKLSILGALRLGRPILILDEPFNGLDLESNLLLAHVLRALASEGATVLVTSHVLEALETTCDRVHLLDGGVIRGSYTRSQYSELRALLSGDAARRLEPLRPYLRDAAGIIRSRDA